MGSWDYSTIDCQGSTATGTAPANGPGAAFVNAGKLGYTAFPSIPGGKGNLDDLAGNTENYYSVLARPVIRRRSLTSSRSCTRPGFVKNELKLGNLTTTTNTPKLISGATAPYLKWQYNLVHKAPAFQLSWDQAYPADRYDTTSHAVGELFRQPQPGQYIKSMERPSRPRRGPWER